MTVNLLYKIMIIILANLKRSIVLWHSLNGLWIDCLIYFLAWKKGIVKSLWDRVILLMVCISFWKFGKDWSSWRGVQRDGAHQLCRDVKGRVWLKTFSKYWSNFDFFMFECMSKSRCPMVFIDLFLSHKVWNERTIGSSKVNEKRHFHFSHILMTMNALKFLGCTTRKMCFLMQSAC